MKIPLTVRTYSEGLKPFCGVHFSYTPPHGRKIWGTFDAFVDTGSPYTFISKTEALKMNLTSDKGGQQVSIGGAPVLLHPIKNPSFKVFCEDKTICDVGIPVVNIALPIENNKNSQAVASKLPSIIGMDLLIHNKLALFFDPSRGIAYLENPDK
jgi:hypothetical protein